MADSADSLVDQWYYLDGSGDPRTRPFRRNRSAHSERFAQRLGARRAGGMADLEPSLHRARAFAGTAAASPVQKPPRLREPLTYAIKVQCVSGPDAGKAYMISMAEVSLGRVSGIGQNDPSGGRKSRGAVVAKECSALPHLSAERNCASPESTSRRGPFRTASSFNWARPCGRWAPLRSNSPVSWERLATRLAKLTSTDKLVGFSLTRHVFRSLQGPQAGRGRRIT